jgi:hypothetical protein
VRRPVAALDFRDKKFVTEGREGNKENRFGELRFFVSFVSFCSIKPSFSSRPSRLTDSDISARH